MTALSNPSSLHLPAPTPEALAHSARLLAHLHDDMVAAGGWISFAHYMERVLYAPGLGYYAGGAAKLGAAGDFVTAPELTPLFGRTLARVVAEALHQCGGGEVLELGAGSGRLAADLLAELAALECLPARYLILEVSPDLRARQREHLAASVPHLLPQVVWLEALPLQLTGVVLANEVLDALPVHLLHWTQHGLMERGVVWQAGAPAWQDRPAAPDLLEAVAALPVAARYLSEINLAAPALVSTLAAHLQRGLLLFADYGFNAAEYYHPQRNAGTLKVHYRHHSLDDPFFLPGLADITAHVDFSAIARAADAAGLELLAYTTQGRFLLDAGLLDLMAAMTPGTPDYLRAAAAVQTLVQPHEMGELFKIMVLGRGMVPPAACRRTDRL